MPFYGFLLHHAHSPLKSTDFFLLLEGKAPKASGPPTSKPKSTFGKRAANKTSITWAWKELVCRSMSTVMLGNAIPLIPSIGCVHRLACVLPQSKFGRLERWRVHPTGANTEFGAPHVRVRWLYSGGTHHPRTQDTEIGPSPGPPACLLLACPKGESSLDGPCSACANQMAKAAQ